METNIEKRETAYHEAGHALAMHLLGWGIEVMSIKPDSVSKGRCIPATPMPPAPAQLLWELVGVGPSASVGQQEYGRWQAGAAVLWAGPLAHAYFAQSDSLDDSVRRDMMAAWNLAEKATRNVVEAGQFDQKAKEWASSRVRDHWNAVVRLAQTLIKDEEVSGEKAKKSLSAGLSRG